MGAATKRSEIILNSQTKKCQATVMIMNSSDILQYLTQGGYTEDLAWLVIEGGKEVSKNTHSHSL